MSAVAMRYAEGLLSLARDFDKVEEYREQIDLVKQSFDMAGVRPFFVSGKIEKKEKKKMLTEVFGNELEPYVMNFLCLLIDKGRMQEYREIFDTFHHLANEELGIREGLIESPRKIQNELLRQLEKELSSENEKVELKEKINRSLISGFRISFEDQVIDASMKQRITKMEETLKRKDGSQWN